MGVTKEQEHKFLTGNLGTKREMAESLEIGYLKKIQQQEEEQKLKRSTGPLEAMPIRDAEGNLLGTQVVQDTEYGKKPYGWMANRQEQQAPLTPPPGMVPKSFNNKTGTTIYGQPGSGTVNVLEDPAAQQPNTRRAKVDQLFGG
jgi:hypothetical protein